VAPAVQKRGGLAIYLGSYEDLDASVARDRTAGRRSAGHRPDGGEKPPEHLARIAHQSRSGVVLVLDHLEQALTGDKAGAQALAALLSARRRGGAGGCAWCWRSTPRRPRAWRRWATRRVWGARARIDDPRSDRAEQAAQILERTALQCGTFSRRVCPTPSRRSVRRRSGLPLGICSGGARESSSCG